MSLFQDTSPRFLIDVLRTLPVEDRADFRETAKDFASGLNATISGAAYQMRRWVANPPSWLPARRQQHRIRFLAALDAVLASETAAA